MPWWLQQVVEAAGWTGTVACGVRRGDSRYTLLEPGVEAGRQCPKKPRVCVSRLSLGVPLGGLSSAYMCSCLGCLGPGWPVAPSWTGRATCKLKGEVAPVLLRVLCPV